MRGKEWENFFLNVGKVKYKKKKKTITESWVKERENRKIYICYRKCKEKEIGKKEKNKL